MGGVSGVGSTITNGQANGEVKQSNQLISKKPAPGNLLSERPVAGEYLERKDLLTHAQAQDAQKKVEAFLKAFSEPAKVVEKRPSLAIDAIDVEKREFAKNPEGGQPAIANAAGDMLLDVVTGKNQEDNRKQFLQMVKEAAFGLDFINVPSGFVDKVVAKLPKEIVEKYDNGYLRNQVTDFIRNAAQKTYAEAQGQMAFKSVLLHIPHGN